MENRTEIRQKDRKKTTENTGKKSRCPISGKCGGCEYIDLPYEEQLKLKQDTVRRLLEAFVKPEPIIGMKDPLYYRNKVNAAFGHDRDGNAISGIYEAESHRILKTDSCFLENKTADAIIVTIRSLLKSFKIMTYSETSGNGLLRHVMIRTGETSKEIMVVLVCTSPIFPSKNNFIKVLRQKHPEITTIILNLNDRDTSMVLGERNITLFGKGFIEDTLCGIRFRISPGSFYQINPVQTEILYRKAIEYASLTGKEEVLDAYCGIGTIGLVAASAAKHVTGVELNRNAVKDAIRNAKDNKIANAEFFAGDAGEFMDKYASQVKPDVLFMDPPRSGSTEKFIQSVKTAAPGRIVYVSCNPVTLARDLKFFTAAGYRVQRAVPVDMFPFCSDVETVVLLS